MSKILEQVPHNFMLMTISISVADPMKVSAIASEAARDATKVKGSTPVESRVGRFGSLTNDLKSVNSRHHAIRTWFYANTLPFSNAGEGKDKRGKRLVPVFKVPDVLVALHERLQIASDALNAFLPEYARYYAAQNRQDLGIVSDVDMPTPEALRESYRVAINPPEPLPVFNVEKLSLPLGLAADIAEKHQEQLVAQLDGAKKYALDECAKHMGLVEKQMRDGARLHQSLLDETVRHASLIRGMVENFDSDPRVLDAVDLLDEKIASLAARGIESVRDNRTQRDEIARAANAVGQILTDVGNAESPLSASIADTPTQSISADDVVLGEMLDDLMNN
tara:strand:- start:437 stop:1444 length:1008 start_codon:yes stop_codon:yes gene_type:complete